MFWCLRLLEALGNTRGHRGDSFDARSPRDDTLLNKPTTPYSPRRTNHHVWCINNVNVHIQLLRIFISDGYLPRDLELSDISSSWPGALSLPLFLPLLLIMSMGLERNCSVSLYHRLLIISLDWNLFIMGLERILWIYRALILCRTVPFYISSHFI